MEKIGDEHFFYTLWHDGMTGEYFLDVLCGTVAQYTVTIRLSEEEIDEYHADRTAVRSLANMICYSPELFMPRNIVNFDPHK